MPGSIAIEIRTLNAVKKKRTYFVSPAPSLPSRAQVRFFTIVVDKWWAKLAIQVLEYQVPNFEMTFLLRLRYVNYEYHWNRQGMMSLRSGKRSLSVSILKP